MFIQKKSLYAKWKVNFYFRVVCVHNQTLPNYEVLPKARDLSRCEWVRERECWVISPSPGRHCITTESGLTTLTFHCITDPVDQHPGKRHGTEIREWQSTGHTLYCAFHPLLLLFPNKPQMHKCNHQHTGKLYNLGYFPEWMPVTCPNFSPLVWKSGKNWDRVPSCLTIAATIAKYCDVTGIWGRKCFIQ